MCFGVEEGRWFNEVICRRVGDGKYVAFWEKNWVSGGALSRLFPRLFILSTQKEASIHDMGFWENGRWFWKFEWQRGLLDRDVGRVEEMIQKFGSFSPKVSNKDSWCWVKEGSGLYSVSSAYEVLQDGSGMEERRAFRHIW